MNPLTVISITLSRLLNILASPFRYVGNMLGFGRLESQARGLSAMRNTIGARFGSVGKINLVEDVRESLTAWRDEREYSRMSDDQPMIYTPEKADYSQIHLITPAERFVLHIGSATRSNTADFVLNEKGAKPLHLTFRRVNDSVYGAPFLLHIREDVEVAVNSRTAPGDAPITNGCRLNIDDAEYLVELFAWQALPYAPRYEVGWYTDKGPVRHENEDAIGMAKTPQAAFFAVADGVGGGAAGELVSQFAIQYLLTTFHNNRQHAFDWTDLFARAFHNMNQEVRRFGMMSQALTGSTLTAVVIRGWDATIAHVGDSRLIIVSGETARQITTDHTRNIKRAANSVDSELPTQLERNVLTRALGKEDTIEPEIKTVRLQPGDQLILMSDGVATRIPLEEFPKLASDYRPTRLAQHLAELANQRFNADNVSVVHAVLRTQSTRNVWVPRSSDRVYTGADRAWSLQLNARPAMYTNYVNKMEWRRNLTLWLVAIVIVVLMAFFILRDRFPAGALVTTPTAIVTPSWTPSPSATRRPVTATTTPTIAPAQTRLAPTSTLAPLPTSTLAPLPSR